MLLPVFVASVGVGVDGLADDGGLISRYHGNEDEEDDLHHFKS
jgi:hypothetical protein